MEQTKANVLDIIIAFTNAIKATPKCDEKTAYFYFEDNKGNKLWGAKYLLGQILRQYEINKDHYLVSIAADKLWKEITDNKSMEDYHYTMQVPVHRECILPVYKGAEKTSIEKVFQEGSKFQYRQVFHDEHIIPIADIIQHLVELEEPNPENVQKILNNIYICRMLKSENAKLSHKDRPWSVVDTVETIYYPQNIKIVDWENKKTRM